MADQKQPLPRRTWPELVSWGLKEFRVTATAMVGIWAVLISTGTVDRIWPDVQTTITTTSAIVEADTDPQAVAAAEAAGEPPPLVAVPLKTNEPTVQIGSALELQCVNDDCTETLQTETYTDGSAIIERRVVAPEGLDSPMALPTLHATDTGDPDESMVPDEVLPDEVQALQVGEVVTLTTTEEEPLDWTPLMILAGLSFLLALAFALIWRWVRGGWNGA